MSVEILSFDDEYKADIEKVGEEYLKRLEEADTLMHTLSVEEWSVRMLSGQDPIPHTTAYEKLAGQENDLMMTLAGVRLHMRRLLRARQVAQSKGDTGV